MRVGNGRMVNDMTKQTIAKQYMDQNNMLDFEGHLVNWRLFVYCYIPNNWLKMHGYPKRRRRRWKHGNMFKGRNHMD